MLAIVSVELSVIHDKKKTEHAVFLVLHLAMYDVSIRSIFRSGNWGRNSGSLVPIMSCDTESVLILFN